MKNKIAFTKQQQNQLALLFKERGIETGDATAEYGVSVIESSQNVDRFPLSYEQEQMWFNDQIKKGEPIYNIPVGFRYDGNLNVEALKQSFTNVIRHHDVLRTHYESVGDKPVQIVSGFTHPAVPIIDLTEFDKKTSQKILDYTIAEMAERDFDLTRGPIFRTALFHLCEDKHFFLLIIHHIAFDGWSKGRLIEELNSTYRSYRQGVPSPYVKSPIQYGDYAIWQRKTLVRDVLNEKLAYWKDHIGDNPPLLELPFDFGRPAAFTYKGRYAPIQISRDLYDALIRFSKQEGVSLFMVLFAAFNVLLFRYTGQKKILLGCPVSGRGIKEIQKLIGCFVNTVVYRTDLRFDFSFKEVLNIIRSNTVGSYANHDLPFGKLVESLHPERDVSYSPLVQVLFNFQTGQTKRFEELPGVTVSLADLFIKSAKFDLSMHWVEGDEELAGALEYNRDLFAPHTIDQLLEHYHALLWSVVSSPTQRLSSLSLLPPQTVTRLQEEFQGPCHPEWLVGTVPADLATQALRCPDALAATCGRDHLSYRALHARADQLAGWLVDQGVARGAGVGVLGERGLDLLVALVGVLKAGAVYVPLDPDHPDDRLRQLITDSRLQALVVSPSVLGRASVWTGGLVAPAGVVCWRQQASVPAGIVDWRACASARPVRTALTGADWAYAFYTSGSTGQPKGALIDHAGMLNHMRSKIEALALDETSVVAQTASHCFDISLWQFLAPLLVGGRVVIYDQHTVLDTRRLLAGFCREGVSVAETVPTLLDPLLAAAEQNEDPMLWPTLAHMVSNAETLPVSLCVRWFARFPQVPLTNTYGITESADDVTHHRLVTAPPLSTRRVLVGRPIANIGLHIVDDTLGLMPLGASGQIVLGGTCVGQGYWWDPRRTAQRFVPDPFASAPGARLYLTGDRGRWTMAGELDFLGRVDRQIKIRGHRLDLGEVEAVGGQHPAVGQVVVVDRPEGHLVAYATARLREANETLAEALRQHWMTRLPNYMVPDAVVVLDELPLNENGKVKRADLPKPKIENFGIQEDEFAIPTKSTEKVLQYVWSTMLNIEQVSINANFFDLGGHSLMATQIVSRLRLLFGREIELQAFFLDPTIIGLSEVLINTESTQGETESSADFALDIINKSMYQLGELLAEEGISLPNDFDPSNSRNDAGNGRLDAICEFISRVNKNETRIDPIRGSAHRYKTRYDNIPLSFSQQRLWVIDQLTNGNSAYNIAAAYQLLGPLNIECLRMAIEEVIRRHSILRTSFPALEGRPSQEVSGSMSFYVPIVDLSEVYKGKINETIKQYIIEEFNYIFDLSSLPLIRITLLYIEDKYNILIFNIHHIIADGWSIRILLREIIDIYTAYEKGSNPPLKDLSVQYVDFAYWQREYLQGRVVQKLSAHWKEVLKSDEVYKLELPTDYPRREIQTYIGESYIFEISKNIADSITKLSKDEGLTNFMTLLAVWKILICNYTKEEEVLIGSPIANRNKKEVEDLIGFFVNMLPLKTSLSGDPSFREFLVRVKKVVTEAYDNQDLPFDKIITDLNIKRDLGSVPLIQVVFTYGDNLLLDSYEFSNFELRPLDIAPVENIKFDLTMDITESPKGFIANLKYNKDLFRGSSIHVMENQYQVLLAKIVAEPSVRISDLLKAIAEERTKTLSADDERKNKIMKLKAQMIKPRQSSILDR